MSILPTFARWLGEFGLPDAPKDQQVTIAWLQYHQTIAASVDEMKADPISGANLRGLLDALSEDIIDSHLGSGWFKTHVDGSASSNQTHDYLRFDGPPAVRLLAAHRVHEVARRLYQLQSYPWFDEILRRVQKQGLSGAGFELDIVFLLHNLLASVTPRKEVGIKGEDYDILLQVGGLEVPVEAKTKDDGTAYTNATVIDTVKQAARQLPKGSNGVVFLRIPSGWVGPSLAETYPDALAEATRQTTRIGAVITVIDKRHLNEDKTTGNVTRHYDYFKHEKCPGQLWDACLLLKAALEQGFSIFSPPPPF